MNYLVLDLPILNHFFQKGILKILWVLSVISLISFFCLSIFQVASFAQEVYLIQTQKKKITQLEEENKNLAIEFSKSNSLSNLNDYLKDFEKVKEVKYIKISGTWVAER
ncbi:hypothetical protein AMJ49_02815 [Parcubacteria bacterium DG_74_2]|nr:MAG: hypothetical protein AMJ49_02815 [Parcubacteria bacterium DG_74_2]